MNDLGVDKQRLHTHQKGLGLLTHRVAAGLGAALLRHVVVWARRRRDHGGVYLVVGVGLPCLKVHDETLV